MPLNPNDTMNIYDNNHLTQIQHKGDHIDIVDHHNEIDKKYPHTITSIDRDGNIDIEMR